MGQCTVYSAAVLLCYLDMCSILCSACTAVYYQTWLKVDGLRLLLGGCQAAAPAMPLPRLLLVL